MTSFIHSLTNEYLWFRAIVFTVSYRLRSPGKRYESWRFLHCLYLLRQKFSADMSSWPDFTFLAAFNLDPDRAPNFPACFTPRCKVGFNFRSHRCALSLHNRENKITQKIWHMLVYLIITNSVMEYWIWNFKYLAANAIVYPSSPGLLAACSAAWK